MKFAFCATDEYTFTITRSLELNEPRAHLTGRPSKAQMVRTTNSVLDTAREFFSKHGFAGSSMDEIATHAGITKRTIYRRYPSKHALLEAVVQRDIERLHRQAGEASTASSSIDALKKTALQLFAYIIQSQNMQFSNFLLAEASFSEGVRVKLLEWENVAFRPVIALIQKAQSDDYLIQGDTNEMLYLLWDVINVSQNHKNLNRLTEGGPAVRADFFNFRWSVFINTFGA